jgi:hypothetical protein
LIGDTVIVNVTGSLYWKEEFVSVIVAVVGAGFTFSSPALALVVVLAVKFELVAAVL